MVYHEKQEWGLCAVHALNNLFQGGVYNQRMLDEICRNLAPNAWINPHKSFFGIGNYDVNVIEAALQLKDCKLIWFDKRMDPSELVLDQIFGFLLNVPSSWRKLPLLSLSTGRHWLTVRSVLGLYYDLDSTHEVRQIIGNGVDVVEWLRGHQAKETSQIFIVVTEEVANNVGWKKGGTALNGSKGPGGKDGNDHGEKDDDDEGGENADDMDMDCAEDGGETVATTNAALGLRNLEGCIAVNGDAPLDFSQHLWAWTQAYIHRNRRNTLRDDWFWFWDRQPKHFKLLN